jgi:uncharacterized membrane protein YfcA
MATSKLQVENQSLMHPITHALEDGRMKYWSWGLLVFVLGWLIALFWFFPEPLNLVQRNWPLFLVGLVGAAIGNATAVGGGLIFIPVMIFVYHFPPIVALKLALASQCFGMTSGALGWIRRGVIPFKALGVTIPGLIIGGIISSLVIHPAAYLVKGLFGPVSIFIGILTLVLLNRPGERDDLPPNSKWLLAAVAFLGGTLTGWVAIGIGEIVAAYLMLAHGIKAERGIGLGVLLLSLTSIFLTLIHQFFLGGIPWDFALFTGFGCVFGGRLGPYLSQRVGSFRLKIGFATVAILDGLIFMLQSIFFTVH